MILYDFVFACFDLICCSSVKESSGFFSNILVDLHVGACRFAQALFDFSCKTFGQVYYVSLCPEHQILPFMVRSCRGVLQKNIQDMGSKAFMFPP